MRPMPWLRRLPALRYRTYREFFAGSALSNLGAFAQSSAVIWQVAEMTGSPEAVGMIPLIRVVPTILLSLPAGVIADQLDRRKVLLATQLGLLGVAVALGWITMSGAVQLWHIYLLMAITGALRAFDMPARHALVPRLVPLRHFPNAVTLNSVAWRISEVGGPVLMGVMVYRGGFDFGAFAVPGLASCYFFNAITFLAMILAYWRMPPHLPEFESESERIQSFGEILPAIREGLAFVRKNDVVRSSMLIDFWATFFSTADALLPFYATDIFGRDVSAFSQMQAAIAVGSFLAALVMSVLRPMRKQGLGVIVAVAIYGLATALFAYCPVYWLALVLLAMTGAADSVSTIWRQTIRQVRTPDRLRGRVGAVAGILQRSGPQLGDYEAGFVGERLGVRLSVLLGGIACLGIAGLWYRSKALREYEHTTK
ncbi:MAG: MFS transporter [Fimbriimonadales bacterium]|nr:MAG: MFS transporter [Fimbriimonadales bacterium]